MSISLIAVFIPILLMGGIVGRLFREFAMTLSVAILISLVISLTTTPMMCALLLKKTPHGEQGRFHRASEWFFNGMLRGYDRTLSWALSHPRADHDCPAGDRGDSISTSTRSFRRAFSRSRTPAASIGGIQADQSISFQLMRQKLAQFIAIVQEDPAVDTRGRLHRRRPDQWRLRVRVAEAACASARFRPTR